MAESVSGAISAAETLLQTVLLGKGIWDGKNQSSGDVAAELSSFVSNLEENIKLLRANTSARSNSATWAFEALQQDLREAAKEAHKILGKGFFDSIWDATKIHSELRVLRERVMAPFQTTVMLAALDVAIESSEKQEEFQEALLRLRNLLRAHTSSSAPALKGLVFGELEELWKPVYAELKLQQEKMEEATSVLKSIQPQTDDNQKFFANVLEELDKAQRERRPRQQVQKPAINKWYHDPITGEIMCDPVKASDRRTYDRWTLLNNSGSTSPSLKVVLDDIDVRSRLFQKFPDQEQIYRSRRNEYRKQALQQASQGRYREALVMLNHVLAWAEDDSECKARRDDVQRLVDMNTPDCFPEDYSQSNPRGNETSNTTYQPSTGRPSSSPLPRAGTSSDMVGRFKNLILNLDTLPSPSKLDSTTCNSSLLSLSSDGLVARYAKKPGGDDEVEVAAVQSDYPVPSGKSKPDYYYFEMVVKDGGERGEISIGFTDKEHFDNTMHVGWIDNTCGYHGDNGELYRGDGLGQPFGPTYGTGDVVGAGIHYVTNKLFFVRNGQLVGAFSNFLQGGLLYPSLGFTTYNQTVRVNFGPSFSNKVQDSWFSLR